MEEILIQTKSLNLTDDQFFQLCIDNKGIRFERDKNKNIIIMAPTGSKSGNRNLKISTEIEIWNRKHNAGVVFDSNAGFTLPNGAVRSPDAAWIINERWEQLSDDEQEHFAPLCPDFVVELLSKSDSVKLLKDKMNEWIENGCRLAWLVDPFNRITFIYKPNAEPTQHPFAETLSGLDVLPGFELKLADIILK